MEIERQARAGAMILRVDGRLDAYWADHLAAALDAAVRGGARRIELDMARVAFMSSVGIRVLLRFHKQLRRIDGSLVVTDPSDAVRNVLDLAGLSPLLGQIAKTTGPEKGAPAAQALETTAAHLQVFDLNASEALRCTLIGNPEILPSAAYAGPSHRLRCTSSSFGIGVGAFGRDFEDCHGRFGELVFAGGAAACLPTDGSNVADYVVQTGALVPELQVLYAITCEGRFPRLLRFEAREGRAAIGLGELVDASLRAVAADTAGLVIVAESAGLVGAALRRSPTGNHTDLFAHPGIREWLSFSPERAHPRGMALIAGVVSRQPPALLAPLLRPLGDALHGHLHAAAFTYHPLPAGCIDLAATVSDLCEREQLQGVLHLLHDARPIAGIGQSLLVRGAIWAGAIAADAILSPTDSEAAR